MVHCWASGLHPALGDFILNLLLHAALSIPHPPPKPPIRPPLSTPQTAITHFNPSTIGSAPPDPAWPKHQPGSAWRDLDGGKGMVPEVPI